MSEDKIKIHSLIKQRDGFYHIDRVVMQSDIDEIYRHIRECDLREQGFEDYETRILPIRSVEYIDFEKTMENVFKLSDSTDFSYVGVLEDNRIVNTLDNEEITENIDKCIEDGGVFISLGYGGKDFIKNAFRKVEVSIPKNPVETLDCIKENVGRENLLQLYTAEYDEFSNVSTSDYSTGFGVKVEKVNGEYRVVYGVLVPKEGCWSMPEFKSYFEFRDKNNSFNLRCDLCRLAIILSDEMLDTTLPEGFESKRVPVEEHFDHINLRKTLNNIEKFWCGGSEFSYVHLEDGWGVEETFSEDDPDYTFRGIDDTFLEKLDDLLEDERIYLVLGCGSDNINNAFRSVELIVPKTKEEKEQILKENPEILNDENVVFCDTEYEDEFEGLSVQSYLDGFGARIERTGNGYKVTYGVQTGAGCHGPYFSSHDNGDNPSSSWDISSPLCQKVIELTREMINTDK